MLLLNLYLKQNVNDFWATFLAQNNFATTPDSYTRSTYKALVQIWIHENDTVKQKRLELQLSHVIHPLIPSYQFIFILAPSNCIFLWSFVISLYSHVHLSPIPLCSVFFHHLLSILSSHGIIALPIQPPFYSHFLSFTNNWTITVWSYLIYCRNHLAHFYKYLCADFLLFIFLGSLPRRVRYNTKLSHYSINHVTPSTQILHKYSLQTTPIALKYMKALSVL